MQVCSGQGVTQADLPYILQHVPLLAIYIYMKIGQCSMQSVSLPRISLLLKPAFHMLGKYQIPVIIIIYYFLFPKLCCILVDGGLVSCAIATAFCVRLVQKVCENLGCGTIFLSDKSVLQTEILLCSWDGVFTDFSYFVNFPVDIWIPFFHILYTRTPITDSKKWVMAKGEVEACLLGRKHSHH